MKDQIMGLVEMMGIAYVKINGVGQIVQVNLQLFIFIFVSSVSV